MTKKTPDEWLKNLYPNVVILDPDGWDRQNFVEDWNRPISHVEFQKKLLQSTVLNFS